MSQQRRRIRMKEAGLCIVCGKSSSDARCQECKNRQKNAIKDGSCTKCGAIRNTIEFIKGKNLCKSCGLIAAAKNRKSVTKEKWLLRRKMYAEKNYINWIRILLISCRKNKKNQRRGIKCDVQLQNLTSLYERQDGKCALTGIIMTNKQHDLAAISIDRIDSSRDYTTENVQLVCKAINLAKNSCTNQQMVEFVNLIRNPTSDPS